MKMKNVLLLACGLALAIAPAAVAQTPEEPARAFVSLGVGYQAASHDVKTSGTFTLYDEQGSYSGSYTVGKGPIFDIGGGAHLFGQMSVGVSYSRYAKAADVPLTVSVPHPLYFNQPRTASMTANDLDHQENWFHFKVYYQLFSSSTFDASVSGGPSIVSVKQESVKDITAAESGAPYTTVNLSATYRSVSKTAAGYNIGFDVNYHLTGSLGAGFFVRYTGGTAGMPWGDVKVGGPQFGGSLRYTF